MSVSARYVAFWCAVAVSITAICAANALIKIFGCG